MTLDTARLIVSRRLHTTHAAYLNRSRLICICVPHLPSRSIRGYTNSICTLGSIIYGDSRDAGERMVAIGILELGKNPGEILHCS